MHELRSGVILFILLTALTGVAYPLLVTGVGQLVWNQAANGSLRREGERVVGSSLLGQSFTNGGYFWSRPSATVPYPYNGAASSGSNQGPLNPALMTAVQDRIASLRAADPTQTAPVPVDLVTASASGLDPHISPAAAEFQVPRVARARGLSPERVRQLVARATRGRTFGILGEPRVDVLELNLSLDAQQVR